MLEAAVRVAQIACGLNPDLPEQTAATRGANPFHHVGGAGQSVLQGIEERAPGLIAAGLPSASPVARPSQKLPPTKVPSTLLWRRTGLWVAYTELGGLRSAKRPRDEPS
jgi:hypothetical protein